MAIIFLNCGTGSIFQARALIRLSDFGLRKTLVDSEFPKTLVFKEKFFFIFYRSLIKWTQTCENLLFCCSSLGHIALAAKQVD